MIPRMILAEFKEFGDGTICTILVLKLDLLDQMYMTYIMKTDGCLAQPVLDGFRVHK